MSRDITKLSSFMQEKAVEFIAKCHEDGVDDVFIICTDRSDADQLIAYNAHASNCKPGQSAHNAKDAHGNPCSEAFDIGIIRAGKYVGDGNDLDYQKAGQIGKALGLVWAGDWVHFKEVAHFQNPNWVTPK
jgi:peptidoglycan L-alanyl-D-glutamate endopeptidase CwlK